MTDAGLQLDGVVSGGIATAATSTPTSFNSDFETSSGWTFTETTAGYGSGYITNGSIWGNPIAPSGLQTVVLRGAMSQTVSGFAPGVPYSLSFYAAQRPSLGGQTVQIKLDSTVIGTVTPDSTDYKLYRLPDFIPGAGSHVISISCQVSGDKAIFSRT